MSLSLSDILARDAERPTAPVVLNFGVDLTDDDRLANEIDELAALVKSPSVKQSDPRHKVLAEKRQELAALRERMRDAQATLEVRALPAGEWLRYKDDHPAREGNQSDLDVGLGYVNATDLVEDLGKWAHKLSGEAINAEAWEKVAGAADSAGILEAARVVVALQERRVTIPKSLTDSSETQSTESA